MSTTERLALLALAPGVYLRAGVRCPRCHRKLRAHPRWLIRGAVIDWAYPCDLCGVAYDTRMKITSQPSEWF